jgi:hypothetical protein
MEVVALMRLGGIYTVTRKTRAALPRLTWSRPVAQSVAFVHYMQMQSLMSRCYKNISFVSQLERHQFVVLGTNIDFISSMRTVRDMG